MFFVIQQAGHLSWPLAPPSTRNRKPLLVCMQKVFKTGHDLTTFFKKSGSSLNTPHKTNRHHQAISGYHAKIQSPPTVLVLHYRPLFSENLKKSRRHDKKYSAPLTVTVASCPRNRSILISSEFAPPYRRLRTRSLQKPVFAPAPWANRSSNESPY